MIVCVLCYVSSLHGAEHYDLDVNSSLFVEPRGLLQVLPAVTAGVVLLVVLAAVAAGALYLSRLAAHDVESSAAAPGRNANRVRQTSCSSSLPLCCRDAFAAHSM